MEEAGARLARPGVVVEPRKMWPSALATLGVDLKGKIAEGALPGRAVARMTDLGTATRCASCSATTPRTDRCRCRWCRRWWRCWGTGGRGWTRSCGWSRPPGPVLVGDLADGLSRYLRVPVAGSWAIVDPDVPPGKGAANSAQRVAAVGRRFELHADIAPGSSVLLVDDRTVTGWTLTLAARAVRRAGADQVQPLVLAAQS